MIKHNLIRILAKGGILTPGYFLKIVDAAKRSGNTTLKFGSRQDILFEVSKNKKNETIAAMNMAGIDFEWKGAKETRKQNIVTTFVTHGILASTSWLTEGSYLQILEQFDFAPQIKINIVDSKQNLQPLFNGQLNFISSETQDYWYVYINMANKLIQLPFLIHSLEIPVIAKYCEMLILNNNGISYHGIVQSVEQNLSIKKKEILTKPTLPTGFFPYYEGIEKMLNGNNFWAGFYWRNNNYSLEFIESVCKLCLKSGIAKISITPWKTFLIKDIKQEELPVWEQLIGRMGINMRHSSFELNWHLPVMEQSAFQLKKQIVRAFDKADVRTFGLTFSIIKKDEPSLYTSIRIIKKEPLSFLRQLNPFISYDIEVAENYNPNSLIYRIYAQNLAKQEIPLVLIELSKNYYHSLPLKNTKKIPERKKKEEIEWTEIYQCTNCYTVYNEQIGDMAMNIKPGVQFRNLPDYYCCPLCESPKSNFAKKKLDSKYTIAE